MKKKEIDIDEIINQINLSEDDVFSLNEVVREDRNKLNWSGLHKNSFRLRLYSQDCKNTRLRVSKPETLKPKYDYQITKDNLLNWLQLQNYGK